MKEKGNWRSNIGPLLTWAIGLLGFFPQLSLLDKYGDKLRAFVVIVAEFLEEAIEDSTDVKLGSIRLAAFDRLLVDMIAADKELSKEPDMTGIKGLAHWILETHIAAQKAKGLWK